MTESHSSFSVAIRTNMYITNFMVRSFISLLRVDLSARRGKSMCMTSLVLASLSPLYSCVKCRVSARKQETGWFTRHRAMTVCPRRTALGLLLAFTFTYVKSTELFTNSFLVKFRRDVDNRLAHNVADRNGFVNMGPVSKIFIPYVSVLNSGGG